MSGLRERTPDTPDDTGESAAARAASLSKTKATRNLNSQFQIDSGQPVDEDWPPLMSNAARQKQKLEESNMIGRLRDRLKAERAEAEKKAEELKAQLAEKQQSIDGLEQRIATLVAQAEKSAEEKADIVIKLNLEEAGRLEAEQEANKCFRQLAEKQQSIDRLEQRVACLSGQVEKSAEEKADIVIKLNLEQAGRLEAEEEAKERGEQLEQLQKDRDEEAARWKKEAEEQARRSSAEIEQAVRARDEAAAEATHWRLAGQGHSPSEAERRRREAEAALAAAESKAGYVRVALADSHARFAKMKSERDVLVAARYVDEQAAVGLRRRMRGLETDLEKARAACSEEKRQRRADQEKLKAAEAALQQAERAAEQSKKDLNEAKVHLAYVKKQLDKKRVTMQQKESSLPAPAAADKPAIVAHPTPQSRALSRPAGPTPPDTPASGPAGAAAGPSTLPSAAAATAAAPITPATTCPPSARPRAKSMAPPPTAAVLNTSSLSSTATATQQAPVPGRSRLLADLLLPGRNVILPDLSAIGFPSCPSLFDAVVQVSQAWVEKGAWHATRRAPPYHLTVWDGSQPPETLAQKGRLLRQLTTPRDKMIVGRPSANERVAARSIDVRVVQARKVEAGDFIRLHDVIVVKAIDRDDEEKEGGGEEGENVPSWRLEARDVTVLREPRKNEQEAEALRATQARVGAASLHATGRGEKEEQKRAEGVEKETEQAGRSRPCFSFASSTRRRLLWHFDVDPVLIASRTAVKRRREQGEDEEEEEPPRKIVVWEPPTDGDAEKEVVTEERGGGDAGEEERGVGRPQQRSLIGEILAQLHAAPTPGDEAAAAAAAARQQQPQMGLFAQMDTRRAAGEETNASAAAARHASWLEELAEWEEQELGGEGMEVALSTSGAAVEPPLAFYESAEANAARHAEFLSALAAGLPYTRGQVWLSWMRTCRTNAMIVERRKNERAKCPHCEVSDCAFSLYAHIPLERPAADGDFVHLLVDAVHFRESGEPFKWPTFRSKPESGKTADMTRIVDKINSSTLVLHRADVMSMASKRVYVVGREPSWITVGQR